MRDYRRYMQTCTQEGMVPSQPGMGVSVTSGGGVVELHVYRNYPHLINEWGGRGVFLRGDAYGRRFPTEQAAWDFALERGYIRPWFYPEARARRLARAQGEV